MKSYILLVFVCITLFSCDYYVINSHDTHVGVIQEKQRWDKEDFKVCFEEKIFPSYYGSPQTNYSQGKDSLRNFYLNNFNNNGYTSESGYITIRFVINCEGKAGRYEVLETGLDFKEKKFKSHIPQHLNELTRRLRAWQPLEFSGTAYDSFFHLTFKIENGEIIEILP